MYPDHFHLIVIVYQTQTQKDPFSNDILGAHECSTKIRGTISAGIPALEMDGRIKTSLGHKAFQVPTASPTEQPVIANSHDNHDSFAPSHHGVLRNLRNNSPVTRCADASKDARRSDSIVLWTSDMRQLYPGQTCIDTFATAVHLLHALTCILVEEPEVLSILPVLPDIQYTFSSAPRTQGSTVLCAGIAVTNHG